MISSVERAVNPYIPLNTPMDNSSSPNAIYGIWKKIISSICGRARGRFYSLVLMAWRYLNLADDTQRLLPGIQSNELLCNGSQRTTYQRCVKADPPSDDEETGTEK